MAYHCQWKAHPKGTLQDPSSFFSRKYNQQQNSRNTWQGQSFANPTRHPQQYSAANPPWLNQLTTNPPWPN
jgi:hypothetical protein